MEPRTDLEQRPDITGDVDLAFRGRRDAAEDLQQRALAGPVLADYADGFARRHIEGDIVERMDAFARRSVGAEGMPHPLRDDRCD